MAHMRMLTPEASPEPETRPSGLWQPKQSTATNTTTTNTAATQPQQQLQHQTPSQQKRKRSWPFPTTRPVSPPSSTSPAMMRDDDDDDSQQQRPGIKAMWESNAAGLLSRTAAIRGQPPFQDAHFDDDVAPIFESLIRDGIDDPSSPEYALAFYPRAHELALHAENAALHHGGDAALAAGLYLRACALLRLGRWSPSSSSSSSSSSSAASAAGAGSGAGAEESSPCPIRARAWHLQKSYHTKAGRLLGHRHGDNSPLDEVVIPHTHDAATRPDESTAGVRERGSIAAAAAATKTKAGPARPHIPAVVRLPQRTLRTGQPCPAVLVVTDDRTAHTALCGDLLARGWGCVVVEAPGFGDCPVPATSNDASAAPLWASVLDWMAAIRVFDMARVVVWAAAGSSSRALSGDDGAPGLVGQFAAAPGSGSRVRGCVAVVSGGEESAVLAVGGEATGQVVRSLAGGSAAVYDWVEDLLSLEMVV